MYTLYSYPGSCSTGINILLKQLGQEVTIINPATVADYQSISPTKQVPALLDDDLVITEGAAIALYLLEKHGGLGHSGQPEPNATFLRWLMFNYATLHPAYSKLFTMKKLIDSEDSRNAVLQTLADSVSELWSILDERLSTRTVVVGDQVTIIDYLLCIYASWNNYFPDQTFTLGQHVGALIDRVSQLPEFQQAYAREGINYQAAGR